MPMGFVKYHNKKVTINGETFDSKKEAARWQELLLLQRAGKISHLNRQVTYELIPSQFIDGKCAERSVKYVADFVYKEKGNLVVEDTKGMKTPEYIIKRKLMLSVYGIRIKEV